MTMARVGDNCQGTIITGSDSVFINGQPAAFVGSEVSPHPHGDHIHVASIATGSSSVFINSIPAARLGDTATCNHTITTASDSVFGGG